ncbi:gamma tubulin complex protein [Holotrichia oblita]|uniref:Gamma tubulin complex protein n=1 Tax=Holotrichia oblita TaxID=644536 RepID=A0ACB9SJ78_HOLOL|nr:gamma tubulin complex protein [Holotrichia oblita]
MQKHFELLRHLFLFKDDIIFPLYRRLFTQMIDHKRFDNDIWLTTQLHDIMIDLYPKFYEKCVVKISETPQILDDPLRACEMVDINYIISWPVNLIICEKHLEMYSELFRLILKVKWALYTLNHLYFHDRKSIGKAKLPHPKALNSFLRKLKVFRFHLLNQFSNIQHYILGYVFNKYLRRFEQDFEAAYNLDTLISSHSNFINSVYKTSMDFQKLREEPRIQFGMFDPS